MQDDVQYIPIHDGNGRRLREWVVILIAFGGWLFSAGVFYMRVSAMEEKQQDFARKDVLNEQLHAMDVKIDALDSKIDQVLREARRGPGDVPIGRIR